MYLPNSKRIQSAAMNAAVAAYGQGAEYLVRLDAHASYPADYCQTLVDEADATGAASVVVAMQTVGSGGFQSAVAAAQNSKLGNGGSLHRSSSQEGRWINHGHHALMRVDAFQAVSGYDENFTHNEDAELDIRLAKAGFRIWFTGRTRLEYHPRSSPVPLFHQYVKYGQGRVRTIQKHNVRPQLRQLAPAAVIPASCLILVTPVTSMAAFPFAAWLLICLTYGTVLSFREQRLWIVMAGPAAVIMHLGWSIGFWQAVVFKGGGRRNDILQGGPVRAAR